ncbi:hypothetical protein PoB_001919200 [Plakobranchus ocellatus]|uniref:Uncharacterized protein n=1 Tax=Plakobranchus ocellatus TaxID=259542 RepID=A0AAV3ZBR1_9GAST|nr:hypothetical protein PoB_001919200 [Plakobranchus ocellatus]
MSLFLGSRLTSLGAIGEVFEKFWRVLHKVSSMALTDVEVSILCALLILCPVMVVNDFNVVDCDWDDTDDDDDDGFVSVDEVDDNYNDERNSGDGDDYIVERNSMYCLKFSFK